MGCARCGRMPARRVQYHRNVGMLLMRRTYTFDASVCISCSRGAFREYQYKNLLLGWWGLFSLFMTPYFLYDNLGRVRAHRSGLGEPTPTDPEVEGRLRGRPLFERPGTILFVAAVTALVAFLALRPHPAAASPESAWVRGACVTDDGDRVWLIPCSSPSKTGEIIWIATSPDGCPANADFYVEVKDGTVACIG